MSVANWKVIYRDYTAEELAAEESMLKEEVKSMYLAQSTGRKSFSRSITAPEERLRALTEIKRENRGDNYLEDSYVDFSHD
jgi:hypothetical protein